jgi:hypothetical protein
MPTATRTLHNSKYSGWDIVQTSPRAYLLTRPGGIYAIAVTHTEARGWEGVLMTRQYRPAGVAGSAWGPAKTPYVHCPLGCCYEADRRERWIGEARAKRARMATTR